MIIERSCKPWLYNEFIYGLTKDGRETRRRVSSIDKVTTEVHCLINLLNFYFNVMLLFVFLLSFLHKCFYRFKERKKDILRYIKYYDKKSDCFYICE